MPKKFVFQIQFQSGAVVDRDRPIAELLQAIRASNGRVTGQSADQDQATFTVNINAVADDASKFWQSLKIKLRSAHLSKLLRHTIIICEGDEGWNDYLLLHHFDKTQKTDSIP